MSFRSVTLLWLLALVPFALVLFLVRERVRARIAHRFATERLRGIANPVRALRPWLLGIALLAAVVALAGPYSGFTLVPIVAREANRVLVIDVSNSMSAEDVGASRLSAAKAIAKRLAEAQQGRIALIVFEAQPEVVSPLTTDTDAVLALLDTLQPGEVGQPGSDVGSALLGALRLIEADPTQKTDIVVISDGEEQGARVNEAVQRAKTHGVVVSAVMAGSAQGSTIPTGRGPLRDSSGDVITTYARSEVLQGIAVSTGGRFLENPFAEHALDPLLSGARATSRRETHARIPVDRYQWPLALAFVLFLGASLVNRGAE
ncbi:MAG TPA: VWA domain-containing protein [Thermoanaerobaculia bacterium]|nr:VWA domain-containing protein [Thermoanaerobaculia bacterium]